VKSIVIVSLWVFSCPMLNAAIQITSRSIHFDAHGTIQVAKLTTEDTDKKQVEDLSSGIEVIWRDDLHKQWIVDNKNKKYQEVELLGSSNSKKSDSFSPQFSTVPVEVGNCRIEVNRRLPLSKDTAVLMGYECSVNAISLDWVCLDKKNTSQELRRIQYRAKIWSADKRSFNHLYEEQAPHAVENNKGQAADSQKSAGLGNKLKNFASAMFAEMENFEYERRSLINSFPKPFMRFDSVATPINHQKVISFRKQQEITASKPVANGVTPTTTPELVASAIVAGVVYGSAKLKTKEPIPSWVLDVDPDFAAHGGEANSEEVTAIQDINTQNLFEIPHGYKKVNKF